MEIRIVNVWRAYEKYAYEESDLDLGPRLLYNKGKYHRRLYIGIIGFGISFSWRKPLKIHNGKEK